MDANEQAVKYVIRPARPEDAGQMAVLMHETVRRVNAEDYLPEQVAAWSPRARTAQEMQLRQKGKRIWVADAGGLVIGFIELDPDGKIDCMYCHHEWQRRGIGTRLLETLFDACRADGIDLVRVEASITAHSFFASHGFDEIREQQVCRQGILLENYLMQRSL